jgi:hypothetical protein
MILHVLSAKLAGWIPGQSHQLTRVPWVYHSCFYSVTDPFHFITPELG